MGRFGLPADGISSMNMLQAGADSTEQKPPFKNFSAADIKNDFLFIKDFCEVEDAGVFWRISPPPKMR